MKYEYKMITTSLIRKSEDGGEKRMAPEEHLVTVSISALLNLGEVAPDTQTDLV